MVDGNKFDEVIGKLEIFEMQSEIYSYRTKPNIYDELLDMLYSQMPAKDDIFYDKGSKRGYSFEVALNIFAALLSTVDKRYEVTYNQGDEFGIVK